MQASDITAVIVCDSVRREVSGKELLVGVYTGNIVSPSFPVVIELAFWFEVDIRETGEQDADIRIVVPGEVPPLEMRFHIATVVPGPFSLATPNMQVPLVEAGELRIELKEGDDWTVVKRKVIQRGDAPSPR
ncbi:MAG TPA: hypothetical protein VMM15_32840 [Bradyrhizobium sp.]|nr:hypothetical protein [Bradyrhizobium sp.]